LFEAEKVLQNLLLQLQFASQQNFGIIPKLQIRALELYYATFDRSVVTAIIFSVIKTTQLTKITTFIEPIVQKILTKTTSWADSAKYLAGLSVATGEEVNEMNTN